MKNLIEQIIMLSNLFRKIVTTTLSCARASAQKPISQVTKISANNNKMRKQHSKNQINKTTMTAAIVVVVVDERERRKRKKIARAWNINHKIQVVSS